MWLKVYKFMARLSLYKVVGFLQLLLMKNRLCMDGFQCFFRRAYGQDLFERVN